MDNFGKMVPKYLFAAEKKVRFSFEVLNCQSFFFSTKIIIIPSRHEKTDICFVIKDDGCLTVNKYGVQRPMHNGLLVDFVRL